MELENVKTESVHENENQENKKCWWVSRINFTTKPGKQVKTQSDVKVWNAT